MPIERIEDIKQQTDRELVDLLQQLVRIPSYVDPARHINENRVVDYLENWLSENTKLDIQRQELDGGRFNLIANRGNPEVIFLAHTDTVQPSDNSPHDQLAAEIHDGKIWGRGTTDMKSGIASMIQAISLAPDANDIWLFLYADEEYDFLGLKALVKKYGDLRPKLLVSSDGSDLRFGHGCRGLIEFRGRFIGQTGHPARGTGNSAIDKGWESLNDLRVYADKYKHPVMGETSFNIAHVLGGARLPDSLNERGRLVNVGQAGNVVADIMDFVVDIRPAYPDLSVDKLVKVLGHAAVSRDLEFEIVERTHQLGAWFTRRDEIDKFVKIAKQVIGPGKVMFDNPGKGGYIDLQMLWEATGRPAAFMFGGGKGDTAHSPNEHIEITDLIKERDFFLELLK